MSEQTWWIGQNDDPDAAGRPLAEIDDATVVYQVRGEERPPALQNTSLTVREREVVALIGPSGCGKSTCLRLLAGLQQPTSGTVRVGAKSMEPTGGISLMFQTPALLDWRSVIGNIVLPLEARRVPKQEALDRARAMIELVGLTDFVDRRPYELSGGQQQRVALARALVTEPSLLLLDEPFGALDAITRDRLCVELQSICAGRDMATLLVTHSVQEAIFLGDRIMVMESHPGRMSEEIQVDFPRPRQLGDRSSAHHELENHLLSLLVPENDRSERQEVGA